ncbi:MAG: Chemotaxis protein CheA [Deltaproteobacteria bacterium ADurb.Bin510]|nr:MAG: Chemotaxis protein CheA [Deltaproteobacteria bacterium ADurb.Bin510]
MLEKLGDPLVHLIRNSLDHGIESPEQRVKAGKPAGGTIELSAEHAGSNVLVKVRDDGKGLDSAAIRAKAVEKGLIAEDAALSEPELFKLIFAPGFSTASQVSNISGRGVGMDVVARSIEALGGEVEIESARGRGTTITLRLPLTLAIIEGLLVAIGDERFVIPLGSVLECIELERERDALSRLIKIRDNLVPYVVLRDVFNVSGVKPSLEHAVIVEVGNERLGLVVDTVIGQQQTVIKNLSGGLTNLDGLAGATILGDGAVALVLDLKGLMPEARKDESLMSAN